MVTMVARKVQVVAPRKNETPSARRLVIRPAIEAVANGEGKSRFTVVATTLRTSFRNGLPALPVAMATSSPARHRLPQFCDLVQRSMLTTAIQRRYTYSQKMRYMKLCLEVYWLMVAALL